MDSDHWGRSTVESLLVRLTEDEAARKASELARHLQETAQLKIARQVEVKRLADEIKEREAREAALAADLVSGTESRPVECFEQPRFSEMLVDVIRADTHEVIRTRPMQQHERQQKMSFETLSREPDFVIDDDDRDDPNPRSAN